MSRADRDRLVAGRENRGFSYTEESDEGEEGRKEGRKESVSVNYVCIVWGGEHISACVCLKGDLSRILTASPAAPPPLSHSGTSLTANREGNVDSVTPLRSCRDSSREEESKFSTSQHVKSFVHS